MKPVVVILAAGASERLGQCKALVDLGGESALRHLIRAALSAGALEVVVIGGAHQREIAAEFARVNFGERVQLLSNANWSRGRTGSAAIAAARFPARDLMIAPIDVPLVSGEVFRKLLEAWERAGDPARGWLAPCIEPGPRYGHPLIVGRELAAAMLQTDPGEPLSRLRTQASPLWSIQVNDAAILDDLDTPEDLKKLRARCQAPS